IADFGPPAQLASAEQVEAWAAHLGHELAEATGFPEAAEAPAPASPADQLAQLSKHVSAALDALGLGDLATAKQEYQQFDAGWLGIEDGVRAKSRDSYRQIETAMREVGIALSEADRPERSAVALQQLAC